MTTRRSGLALAALLLLGPRAAAANSPDSQPPIHLLKPPPVARHADAFPLIAQPATDAERRVNTALRRLDARLRRTIAACRTDDGHPGDWTRTIDVTMRGPRFLSYTITDDSYCGGAHPDGSLAAIVYDLATGAPIDWTAFLPPALTGTLALQQSQDGAEMVTLASPRLTALYVAGYGAGNATAEDQAACKTTIQEATEAASPPTTVWLDAARGGLALQFGLSHAVQNCEDAVVVPAATLARQGAAASLLAAFRIAQPHP